MADEPTIDPATGLLHRAAFLKEVRDGQAKVPPNVRRGCLLILHFPMLQVIAEQGGSDAATAALRNLLAVVETRLRSRDTLGRIAQHSLCVLLRQCREKDALIIAEQYAALLRDVIIDTGDWLAPMELRYRIVPLDAVGSRARQGVSRFVKAAVPSENTDFLDSVHKLREGVDTTSSKVVSIETARVRQKNSDAPPQASTELGDGMEPGETLHFATELQSSQSASALRLKPGLLLGNKPLVCCYRLQHVGGGSVLAPLQASDIFQRVLNALALNSNTARPLIESQLIIPVEASQLTVDTPVWLKDACGEKRVAPSDVCLSLTVDSLCKELRVSVPVLRALNRQGIRLMLERVNSVSQFRTLQNLVRFDYLHISARVLLSSLNHIRQRQELDALIAEAHAQHREVCSAGVDSRVLLAHTRQLDIDIGFGRECGKSLPFPAVADPQK